MSEGEKIAYYRQKDKQEYEGKLQGVQFQIWDSTDRAEFRQLTREDPLVAKVKDKVTKEERLPDEDFMKSIEENIGISGSAKDGFRSDVTAYMFAKMRRGDKVDYKAYEPLREAIEAYLINSVKSFARIVTKSKSRDSEQQEKYSEMVKTMIKDYGYTADSAEEILAYAANHLWRDG